MTSDLEVNQAWAELLSVGSRLLVKRVPNSVHLAQFCALDNEGRFVYYVDCEAKPEALTELNSLSVSVRQTSSGSWRRSITLLDADYFDEFETLIESLIEAASNTSSEKLALRAQFAEYERWLTFYEKRRGFSLSEARGLYGELKTLQLHQLSEVQSWSAALESWQGPSGSPQDFIVGGNKAIEVKTINISAKHVQINGAEQLDFEGNLVLRVIKVSASKHLKSGETLNDVIAGLSSTMTVTEANAFRKKLAETSFDPKSEFSNDWLFEQLDITEYDVRDTFPKIGTASIPGGISDVKYRLRLKDIESHKSD